MFMVHDLRASRVNLLMNDFACGLPSPLALLGLGAAIAPQLGADRWSVAVLPVLHEIHVAQGRTKPEMQPGTRGSKPVAFSPVEMVEDMTGSVRLSLILDIPDCHDEHTVEQALLGKRIAGGVIHNQQIRVERFTPDGSLFCSLERGFAMLRPDRGDLAQISTGQTDSLTRIAELLYGDSPQPCSGWQVPVAVGHRLLEDPSEVPQRANTRDPDIPHVFTEPMLGIAELVSVRNPRLTELDRPGLEDRLWRWVAKRDWITGHPFYHPDHSHAIMEETAHGQATD